MPKFVRFTDRNGARWRVYGFSILAGRVLYANPSDRSIQYHGFAPDPRDDGRPRRRFMVFKPAERETDESTLQLQLDLSSLDYRDDPSHPLNLAMPSGTSR